MSTNLEDIQVNVKIKLAGLWTSLMFLYIYADYFSLYQDGHLEDIMAGEIAGFEINQTWLLGVMVLMSISSVMIFLSVVLDAKLNRITNLGVGIFQLLVITAAVIGESNWYYIYATALEAVILVLILRYAWLWPTADK